MISWGFCLLICTVFYEGPSNSTLITALSSVAIAGFVSLILSYYRILLSELSILAVRDFMWLKSDNGCVRYSDSSGVSIPHEVLAEVRHVSKQRLIAKLGMGCKYKGLNTYTTMFYLGIDPCDKMAYREVPSELLRLGAESCLAHGNDEDISEFCRWMWKSTPAPAPMPENPAADNGWMLAVAGNVELYRQFRPLYAKSPQHFKTFQEVAKKIVARFGLQAKNPPGDAFILGHRALYGQEETLARFPSSGKVLLAKDLDL